MAEITRYIDPIRTAVIDESRPADPIWMTSNGSMTYTEISSVAGSRRRVVVSLEALAEQYKYNKLLYAQMNVTRLSTAGWISLATMPGGFPTAGTWTDALARPHNFQGFGYGQQLFPVPTNKSGSEALTEPELSKIAKAILSAQTVVLYPGSANTSFTFYSSYYNLAGLQLYVKLDTAVTITSKPAGTSKTAGYVSPYADQTFAWALGPSGEYYCLGDWTQVSAVFYWRQGDSGSWTEIPISGDTQSVTIPAGTFSAGNVQWYVETTDDQGTTADSEVYTITTADSLATASPIAPIGTVEDGSDDIVFTWQESNDTGTTPTGADLQFSQDGATWTAQAHVDGAATSYTVPGGTLPPGTVLWQVRAYNADGVAGNWSEAASFVSVTAPPAPIVAATAVPFSTVTWQSTGQQAYRITVDGTVYGPYFGTAKTWTAPDYLPDGEHTITVEVQGVYGLWSQPGSASFTVQNQPGDAVTLSGEFERDGVLSWLTASQTADFLIYRDGVQIGHTSAPAFTDRFALGEHSYQVINRLPDGNYTASNIVTGTMLSCVAAIAPLSGGDWLELTLSENSNREEAFIWTQTVSMRHFAGAEYPVAEQSPFADLSGSYDVSFRDLPSAKTFEALRGQAVILKSRGGNVMIGILSTLSKRMTEFYIAFTFTLQRMHWRDFIDADSQL